MSLTIKNLEIRRGNKRIIHGMDLTISPSSWTGVIGANGSGKTTLLSAIAGRLDISNGAILIKGEDFSSKREMLAQKVGFCVNISGLPLSLTLNQLHDLMCRKTDSAHSLRIKSVLGLEALSDQRLKTLSSGYRQRVAIYLAFLRDPEIIILDEPFNWLDPVVAYDLKLELKNIVKEGLTLITALHDISTLVGFCDSGFLLRNGKPPLELNGEMLSSGRENPAEFEKDVIQSLRDN